jgi:hypothetical protein
MTATAMGGMHGGHAATGSSWVTGGAWLLDFENEVVHRGIEVGRVHAGARPDD